jgi:alpha-mannosidase
MKFALEHQNPLVTGAIIGKDGGAYPETTHSLLNVSNPNVLLWALKPQDDGIEHGVVVRLWNISDTAAKSHLSFAPGLSAAHRTTHIETDLEAIPLSGNSTVPVTFGRQQLQTVRLELKSQRRP